MKFGKYYIAWGVLYAICAGLGFIPYPKGMAYAGMLIFALVFFIPPTVILAKAVPRERKDEVKRVFYISIAWLVLTLTLLVLNFLTVASTELVGDVMYGILTVVSSPMICGQIWVITIFLWGCLLTASGQYLWKNRKKKKK